MFTNLKSNFKQLGIETVPSVMLPKDNSMQPEDSAAFLAQSSKMLSVYSVMHTPGGGPVKSLHMNFKKKEAIRIDEENQRMIDRIVNV